MADLADLKTQLLEAQLALHKLMIGSQVVEIRVKGRWISKSPADKTSLKQYIKELHGQIDRIEGVDSRRRPIGLHSS
jgi:hypothetical protein